eukprot:7443303-Pyramimonas_sp.AAC.1
MVFARDHHVRYPPGWPGHAKTRAPARDNYVRYPPGWPEHVKTRGSNSGQSCYTPLGGLDT